VVFSVTQRCILHAYDLPSHSANAVTEGTAGRCYIFAVHDMKRQFLERTGGGAPVTAHLRRLVPLCLIVLLAACASAPETRSSVIKTLQGTGPGMPYSNVLVISAAGDRASRSRFEQELAAAVSGDDAAVTPYFAVAGRYAPISRNVLNNIVRVREFDAVLLVRRQGQERPEFSPNRPTGRRFDFFLYDYEELNDTTPLDVQSTVTFVAEVYDTAAVRKVWSIESLVFDADSADAALATQISIIAAELRKDELFAD